MMAGSELRDPFKSYHKMTLKEFSETIPIVRNIVRSFFMRFV